MQSFRRRRRASLHFSYFAFKTRSCCVFFLFFCSTKHNLIALEIKFTQLLALMQRSVARRVTANLERVYFFLGNDLMIYGCIKILNIFTFDTVKLLNCFLLSNLIIYYYSFLRQISLFFSERARSSYIAHVKRYLSLFLFTIFIIKFHR